MENDDSSQKPKEADESAVSGNIFFAIIAGSLVLLFILFRWRNEIWDIITFPLRGLFGGKSYKTN